MRFPLAIGVLTACGLAAAAPIPKEKGKPVKDEEAIQGTWVLDQFEGRGAPPPDLGPIRFTFKDGKLEVNLGNRPADKQGEYKLDPTAKPKTIDLTNNQQTAPGIYELDGDTLRICLSEGRGAVRPTEFKSDGQRVALVTFKRLKDEKKEK